MHVRLFHAAIAACGLVLGVGGGCGDPGGTKPATGKVHGKVLYNGKPLTKGIVTFVPILGKGGETGQLASGNIESDGTFSLTTFNTGDGAILGQHVATVREDLTPAPPPDGTTKVAVSGQMPDFSKKGASAAPKSGLPAKYANVETSPLKYTVEKKNDDITIELKD